MKTLKVMTVSYQPTLENYFVLLYSRINPPPLLPPNFPITPPLSIYRFQVHWPVGAAHTSLQVTCHGGSAGLSPRVIPISCPVALRVRPASARSEEPSGPASLLRYQELSRTTSSRPWPGGCASTSHQSPKTQNVKSENDFYLLLAHNCG